MSEAITTPPKGGTPNLNTAPLTTGEVIQAQNRQRFNPLRMASPERLSQALDSFNAGLLSSAALLWERIIERDDTLCTVEPKRRAEVSAKTWRIERVADANETEAARHEACLQYFYTNSTAVNAYDRNERGEFERLVTQMMSAPAMRYATHHLVWKPEGQSVKAAKGGMVPVISAEFEFVPLYFFENTTGTLRYDKTGLGVTGAELGAREWMVTCGQGLMFAASICWMFKRLSFHDWVNFNERYAQGKIIGRTPAGKDTAEGQAMAEMVRAFTGDMAAVVYNDQGGDKSPLEVIEPKGTASVEAFAKFVERQDRQMITMFRGADLETMSAKDGQGQGASLQGKATEAMTKCDTTLIGGTLRRTIDRWVIEVCFGEGVKPLAYIRLDGEEEQEKEDTTGLRESAGFLADRGVEVDAEEIAERLNVPLAVDGVQVLGKAAPSALPAFGGATVNAAVAHVVLSTANDAAIVARTMAAMSGVLVESVRPTAERIATLMARLKKGDITALEFAAEAEAIAKDLPELLTTDLVTEIAAPMEGGIGTAVLTGAGAGLRKESEVTK